MNNNEKNQVMFKRGLHANLPTSGVIEGAFYLTTDSDRLYVGKADGTLADLNKYVKMIDSLANGATLPVGEEGDFLYIKDDNILAVYTDGAWKQVNPDTNTNTTYDLKAVGSENKASVQLGSKELGDSEFAFAEKFNIIGAGIAKVSVDGNAIKISVDATDLSDYYTKTEIDGFLATKADKSVVDELVNTTIPGIEEDIEEIVGTTIPGLKSELEGKINLKADQTAVDAIVNTTIPALEQDIADVDAKFASYDTTTVSEGKIAAAVKALEDGQVKLNKEAIELLNANSETTGSVDQKIKTAIAEFTSAYIEGNEDEVINRLQEIVNWINTDEDGVTKIIADIEKNKQDIGSLDSNKADKATTYTKDEVDEIVEGIEQEIIDLPDVTVAEGTGIDVAKNGDEYTVSLEAITKNDTTGTAKVQQTPGSLSFDAVTGVTYDTYGRVTGVETTSITVTDTVIEDTHNKLDKVEVEVTAADDKNLATVAHSVAMTDGESDSSEFAIGSSYTEENGGIEVTANGANVNLDFVWGSF